MDDKMRTMNIRALVLNMSIPIMISMLVQALYNIVDSMFVAQISVQALTAVSLCYPVQTMMVAVACGIGVGFNALLSRYLGEGNKAQANWVVYHGLVIALGCWMVFFVFGLFGSKPFLSFFTEDPEILSMGCTYLRICTMASVGVFVQITYERIMQATGQPVYNMILQGLGALANIILDPILIFGYFGLPVMGVAGAAIATVLGQILAMGLGIWIINKRIHAIQVHLKWQPLSKDIMKRIFTIGIPAILMQSIASVMTVFMNMILMPFSAIAVSVFGIYYKLQQFVFMAINGINNALVPILSYNYGAHLKKRISEAIRFSLVLSCIITVLGTIIFHLFPAELLYLFNADVQMLEIGIPAIQIISWSFVPAGISMILGSAFQALEHPNASLVITILRQLVFLIPLTWILSSVFDLSAGWYGFLISEGICMIISLLVLKRVDRITIQCIEEAY